MYNKLDLEREALKVIKKNELVFISDIVAYMVCSRSTFYEYELDKSDILKEEIEKNKTTKKVGLRKKWYDSENATVQIALYKLLATDTELRRLQSNYVELTGKDGSDLMPQKVEVSIVALSNVPPVTSEDDIQDITGE